MKSCERCGARPKGYDLLDYCASCGKDLCADCMAKGCCKQVPAESGMAELSEENGEAHAD